MRENRPSATAQRVAMRRAVHQILDQPKVLDDPIALRILGTESASALQADPQGQEHTPLARYLRAFLAVRSRFAEDELALAVERGVRQYVVLGAGLDTFAYRNPHPALRVFEVDHPATQAWKRERLGEAEIPIPGTLTFAPVNFENQTLPEGLRRSGFRFEEPTFFSWLGVTPYLTRDAVTATLQFVAARPAGSAIVFDYAISPSLLSPSELWAFEALARRVAAAGEPFQTFFDPPGLMADLRAQGFVQIEDLDGKTLNERYFQGRTDGLRVGSLAHMMAARL